MSTWAGLGAWCASGSDFGHDAGPRGVASFCGSSRSALFGALALLLTLASPALATRTPLPSIAASSPRALDELLARELAGDVDAIALDARAKTPTRELLKTPKSAAVLASTPP